MSKFIVVSIKRDSYFWPKLTVVVEARVPSAAAGERLITARVMNAYRKRLGGKMSQCSRMRITELRVVDAQGLKRLQAAAKASVTVRRKRAAKKAAVTRARNRQAMQAPVPKSFTY